MKKRKFKIVNSKAGDIHYLSDGIFITTMDHNYIVEYRGYKLSVFEIGLKTMRPYIEKICDTIDLLEESELYSIIWHSKHLS